MKSALSILCFLFSFIGYSQSDIAGIWNSGEENTTIEISEIDGSWVGKIKTSDNETAKVGRLVLRNLEKEKDNWRGQIYAVRRNKWFDVEISPEPNHLKLAIITPIGNKLVQWTRSESE